MLFSNLLTNIAYANNTKEADFVPYMRKIQHSIKSNWHPKNIKESTRAVVLFKVDRQGNVVDSQIVQSSGDNDYDNEALAAIEKTQPFNALPKDYNGAFVDIQFTFDYNVYKSMQDKLIKNIQKTTDLKQENEKQYTGGKYSRLIKAIENNFQSWGVEPQLAHNLAVGLVVFVVLCIFLAALFSRNQAVSQYQNYYVVDELDDTEETKSLAADYYRK